MAPWVVGSEAEARPGQTGSVPTRAVIALQTSADTPAPPPHSAPVFLGPLLTQDPMDPRRGS